MKDLYIVICTKIKKILNICNSKGCYKKAVADIYIKEINIKGCLCKKHLENFKKYNINGEIKEK